MSPQQRLKNPTLISLFLGPQVSREAAVDQSSWVLSGP